MKYLRIDFYPSEKDVKKSNKKYHKRVYNQKILIFIVIKSQEIVTIDNEYRNCPMIQINYLTIKLKTYI